MMKIILTKDDVMAILCDHFSIEFTETMVGVIEPSGDDEVYWEGNPEIKKRTRR